MMHLRSERDRNWEPSWASPRQAIFIARDLLLIGAVLFYVIGFTYQTAKLQRYFGASLDGSSRIALSTWAFEALRNGTLQYAAIATLAMCFVAAAAYVKRICATRPFGAPLCYGLAVLGVGVAVFGSCWLAWQMGSGMIRS